MFLLDLRDAYVNNDLALACFAPVAEAGLRALRERRMRVNKADFTSAKEQVLYRKTENTPEGLYL